MCSLLVFHESAYVNPEWIVADACKLLLSDLLLSEPKGASEGGLTGICHKDPPEGAPRLGGVFFLFTPGIRFYAWDPKGDADRSGRRSVPMSGARARLKT